MVVICLSRESFDVIHFNGPVMMKLIIPGGAIGALFLFIACMPAVHPPGEAVRVPELTGSGFLTRDNVRLPVRSWVPDTGTVRAVIIAVHGFNDYSNFFSDAGTHLCSEGIASYAFDQRGFGAAPHPGFWPGIQAYVTDLAEFTMEVKSRHPGVPVYLLGESMGGAVVIVAQQSPVMPRIDGVILSAPAVWGRATMPWYQQVVLWLTAHTVPWMTLTGEGLGVRPSDNIEMLRALNRDPLVIKETRVESIYGLVDLMDDASEKSASLSQRTLFLYGEKDEVIPKSPVYKILRDLLVGRSRSQVTVALYENGYHMLLRDLQASIPWNDIAAWIQAPDQSLPSGADIHGREIIANIDPSRL